MDADRKTHAGREARVARLGGIGFRRSLGLAHADGRAVEAGACRHAAGPAIAFPRRPHRRLAGIGAGIRLLGLHDGRLAAFPVHVLVGRLCAPHVVVALPAAEIEEPRRSVHGVDLAAGERREPLRRGADAQLVAGCRMREVIRHPVLLQQARDEVKIRLVELRAVGYGLEVGHDTPNRSGQLVLGQNGVDDVARRLLLKNTAIALQSEAEETGRQAQPVRHAARRAGPEPLKLAHDAVVEALDGLAVIGAHDLDGHLLLQKIRRDQARIPAEHVDIEAVGHSKFFDRAELDRNQGAFPERGRDSKQSSIVHSRVPAWSCLPLRSRAGSRNGHGCRDPDDRRRRSRRQPREDAGCTAGVQGAEVSSMWPCSNHK